MRPRFSVHEAIATHLNEDAMDVKGRRYQPTRTPCAVYAAGNDYLTATKNFRQPRSDKHWVWVNIPSPRAIAFGWWIWKAKP